MTDNGNRIVERTQATVKLCEFLLSVVSYNSQARAVTHRSSLYFREAY